MWNWNTNNKEHIRIWGIKNKKWTYNLKLVVYKFHMNTT